MGARDRAQAFLDETYAEAATETEMERAEFDLLAERIDADLAAAHETVDG